MSNILGSSEFLNAINALSRGLVAGQPNLSYTGIPGMIDTTQEFASGLAVQEQQKKYDKDKKKAKKKGMLGDVLRLAGKPFGPVGDAVSGTAAGMIEGQKFGDAFMDNAAGPLLSAGSGMLGDHLMDTAVKPQTMGNAGSMSNATNYRTSITPGQYNAGVFFNRMGGGDAQFMDQQQWNWATNPANPSSASYSPGAGPSPAGRTTKKKRPVYDDPYGFMTGF